MKQLLLASGNAGKLKELTLAMADFGYSLQPQPKDSTYEVAETGTTFVENAIIKARHSAGLSGLPTLADDSGLIVPSLNGEPGVYSARYAGDNANDKDNNAKLLKALHNSRQRQAYFYCCLVLMQQADDPAPVIAEGRWYGEICLQPSGDGGFGYDPIFYVPNLECTAAQLSADEKSRLSHRGQAVQNLKQLLAHNKQS